MWYYGLVSNLISKAVIDRDEIALKAKEKIELYLTEIATYSEIIEGLDPDKPVSWLKTASKVLDKFIVIEESDWWETIEWDYNFSSYFATGDVDMHVCKTVLKYYKHEKIIDEQYCKFYYFPDVEGVEVGYVDDSGEILLCLKTPTYQEDKEKLYKILSKYFWNSKAVSISFNTRDAKINLDEMSIGEYEYWGPLEEMSERWPKYKEANIRRTAIVQGPPGTGKTTFCYWLAHRISDRTLTVDVGTLEYLMSIQALKPYMNLLQPDMIIINDIHTASVSSLEHTLSAFEEGPNGIGCSYIICTSNDLRHIPAPLQRAGRLGDEIYIVDKIEFTDEVKDKIIKGFEEKIDYKIPDEYRDVCLDIYMQSGRQEVYLLEAMKRAKVEGEGKLKEMLQQLINDKGDEDEEEESYYDECEW